MAARECWMWEVNGRNKVPNIARTKQSVQNGVRLVYSAGRILENRIYQNMMARF